MMGLMSEPQPPIRERLALNVRRLRLAREWSQDDLASRSGLHHNQISSIERARTNVGIDLVDKLALALGASVGELLD